MSNGTNNNERLQPLRKLAEDKDKGDGSKWLQVVYQEAWRQYTHEDTLAQSRNNFFIALQGAFLAFSAAMTGHLATKNPLVLGIILIVIGFYMVAISIFWCWVISSGQRYLNVRWVVAKAIENVEDFKESGLAGTEHRWGSQTKSWYPFGKEITDEIKPKGSFGGWRSAWYAAVVSIVLWVLVCFVGFGVTICALCQGR